jgi:4-carboxymuconolactone decarboxylase
MIAQMLPELLREPAIATADGTGLADELGDLAVEDVFGRLWARPGLDLRSRSLVTLGILIALRAEGEQRFHWKIALRNGLTVTELEEVIYHAAGYAGFPAAATARKVAQEVITDRL